MGLNFSKIKQALDFNLDKVVGALVTHEHIDHVGKNKEGLLGALYNGVSVFSSKKLFDLFSITNHNAKTLEKYRFNKLGGGFQVYPFDAVHCNADLKPCVDPLGFVIYHKDCGLVLFITDSQVCKPIFKGVMQFNNIIIEANYCEEIMKSNLENGKLPTYLYNRILKSHMSLNTCKDTLLANDLSQVQKIVLIHLSDGNSDERKFKKVIEEATGKIVHVANNNQILEFNKNPF